MAKADMKMEIVVNSKTATKQIEKATRAAEKLNAELNKLQQIEICIKVVEDKRRWWEFWKSVMFGFWKLYFEIGYRY